MLVADDRSSNSAGHGFAAAGYAPEGAALRDLQRRLQLVGVLSEVPEEPAFGTRTRAALAEFQAAHGLEPTGDCDAHTWEILVEASYRLGDRLLYLTRPYLRGEDVVELQARLSGLGFDCGGVDGIFGPLTTQALRELQRNAGIGEDGVCGRATLAELNRLSRTEVSGGIISDLKARRRLQAGASDPGGRILLADGGGLAGLCDGVARNLAGRYRVMTSLYRAEPDQAAEANAVAVDLVLRMEANDRPEDCALYYYKGIRYESRLGKELAVAMATELRSLLPVSVVVGGRALPILRETRMPCLVLHLAPLSLVVERAPDVVQAVGAAIDTWVSTYPAH